MKVSNHNLYKYIFVLIFLPLLIRFFTENFGMTYAVMPLFDFYAMVLLLVAFYFMKKKNYILELWLFVFVFVAILSLLVNGGTSFSNFYYSIRPYSRMIIAMMISALALKLKHFERLFKYMETLLYVNAIVMTYQYIFQGLRQDVIGGTFGNSQGVNAIQNLLCVCVCCVTIEYYLNRIISKLKLIINVVAVFYIAILAEINMVFFEVVIIGVVLFLLGKYKHQYIFGRKLFLILAGVCGAVVGLYLFMKFNPERLFLLSPSNIFEYLGYNNGSTGVYRISRVRVFLQLGESFFKNNLCGWLFGFGLGNCSTHSSFYSFYQNLQYTFFSSSYVFLETGLLGVFANIGTIITTLILSIKNRKKVTTLDKKIWMDISVTITIIMLILFFYNTTLRDTYTAFLAGLLLTIPYVVQKE